MPVASLRFATALPCAVAETSLLPLLLVSTGQIQGYLYWYNLMTFILFGSRNGAGDIGSGRHDLAARGVPGCGAAARAGRAARRGLRRDEGE